MSGTSPNFAAPPACTRLSEYPPAKAFRSGNQGVEVPIGQEYALIRNHPAANRDLRGRRGHFHGLGIAGDFLLVASVELFDFQIGK